MSLGGKIIRFREDINWGLIVSASFLFTIGIISLYSIEKIQIANLGSSNVSFRSQVIYSFLGVMGGIIGYRLNSRFLRLIAPYLFYLSLTLLIATYIFGVSVKGSVRWLNIGGVSIQSGDIARFSLILYIGRIFSDNKVGWNTVTFKSLISIVIVTVLILFQPDYGSAMITFLVGLLMLFVLDIPLSMFLPTVIIFSYLGYKLLFIEPYRVERVLAFLNPWKDPLGDGYQYIQALRAFSKGGIFGLGLGRGEQKINILPEVHTDLILAHIGEELGFIVTILVITLYIVMYMNMFRIARDCPLRFPKIAVLGFALSLTLQTAINIGGELKILPLTGVPLPLLSSGGTCRVISLFMIGYSLGISRYRSGDI